MCGGASSCASSEGAVSVPHRIQRSSPRRSPNPSPRPVAIACPIALPDWSPCPIGPPLAVNITDNPLIGGGTVEVEIRDVIVSHLPSFATLSPLHADSPTHLRIAGSLGCDRPAGPRQQRGVARSAPTTPLSRDGASRLWPHSSALNLSMHFHLDWPTAVPPIHSGGRAEVSLSNVTFDLGIDLTAAARRILALPLLDAVRPDCVLATLDMAAVDALVANMDDIKVDLRLPEDVVARGLVPHMDDMSDQLRGLLAQPR